MHLRTHIADVFLNVPDTLPCATLPSEEGNITGIRLRIIGTYQAKQGALSRTIGTTQSPLLPTLYRPIQCFQDGAILVTDAYFVQANHLLGRWSDGGMERWRDNRQCLYLLLQLFIDDFFFLTVHTVSLLIMAQIRLTSDFRHRLATYHRQHMGDEGWYLIEHREHQDDLQALYVRELRKQFVELCTGFGIEPYERIVHNHDARLCEQYLSKLELAHLTARKGDNGLIQHLIDVKEAEQLALQSRFLISSQQLTHHRHFVMVGGVPAHLVVIVGIRTAIGIAEGDVLDVLIHL